MNELYEDLVLTAEETELIKKQRKRAEQEEMRQAVAAEKKTISFSKQMMKVVLGIALVVIVYSMIVMFATKDLSALPTLISATCTFSGVAVGFYSAKAAAENIHKYSNN